MSAKFTDYTKDRQRDMVLHALFRDGGPLTDREIAMVMSVHSPDIAVPLQLLLEGEFIDYTKIGGEWMYTITDSGKDVAASPEFFANQPKAIDVPVTRRTTVQQATAKEEDIAAAAELKFASMQRGGAKPLDGRSKAAKAAKNADSVVLSDKPTVPLADMKVAGKLTQAGGLTNPHKHLGSTTKSDIGPAVDVSPRPAKCRCQQCRLDRGNSEFESGSLICVICVRNNVNAKIEAAQPKELGPHGQVLTHNGVAAVWKNVEVPKFGIFSNGELHINIPDAQIVNGVLVIDRQTSRDLIDFVCDIPEKLLAPSRAGGDA